MEISDCRGHTGRRKMAFRSTAEARKWIRLHARPGGDRLYVYDCPRCPWFHTTTREQW